MLRSKITIVAAIGLGIVMSLSAAPASSAQQLSNRTLTVAVESNDGSFQLSSRATENHPVLTARPGAEIDNQWISSKDYPRHNAIASTFSDALGAGHQIAVTCSGLQGKPDLIYTLQLYDQQPYATIEVTLQNRSGKTVTVQAIRSVEASGEPVIGIDGPESADRILSDSYSEDWPRLQIYDLGDGPRQMHRAAWSQVIYNRQSKQSLFLGALSADRFVTLLHLAYEGRGDAAKITSYTVDSTGTTELQKENSLRQDPPEDAIDLSLPLDNGQTMSSERVMMTTGSDYHSQLLSYGEAIRKLHNARVNTPNLMGWWSWTPYHMAINEGASFTNAEWLAENLKSYGYKYFFIDEGYQYARGEYATANARLFPEGMRVIGERVNDLGLIFGVWTAPFEVSNRAWVYENHKDWLVHTAQGTPIPIVQSTDGDTVYALDVTNPAAQEYLRQTYTTLIRDWGVRFFKFDFMDTASIEGYRYRPNTTAMEAEQIGLAFIRKVIGDDVLIDKDGSPMLNPVGLVDMGRISADTSHSFQNTKQVEPGIAARFYMNRNYFLDDPDAFNVASELPVAPAARGVGPSAGAQAAGAAANQGAVGQAPATSGATAGRGRGGYGGQGRQGSQTLAEAEAAITLSALSGGMFEIGDDLPILGAEKDRLDLLENKDLLDVVRISRAAIPIDLLSYDKETDEQPSVFFLKEDPRQSILAVFNWTDQPRSRTVKLSDLGIAADHSYRASDIFDVGQTAGPAAGPAVRLAGGALQFNAIPSHSVRVIKLIDSSVAPAAPTIIADLPSQLAIVEMAKFSARAQDGGVPALSYHWDFGDGTTADGPNATHAYTRDGNFSVELTAQGLDGIAAHQTFTVSVSGAQEPGSIQQNTRYHDSAQ